MTKTRILIQSLALGVILSISSPAHAVEAVDQVLVQYFKKLYGSGSPKCAVDPAVQTKILREIEPKCLVRDESKSFIAGIKPACTEESVRSAVDGQVNALCQNTAFVADQARVAKLKEEQLAAQKKQEAAAAAAGATQGSSGNTLAAISQGLQMYSQMAPAGTTRSAASSAAAKKDEAAKKSTPGVKPPTPEVKDVTAKAPPTDGGNAPLIASSPKSADVPALTKLPSVEVVPVNNAAIASGDTKHEVLQSEIDSAMPGVQNSAKALPQQAQEAGKATVAPNDPKESDPKLVERFAKSNEEHKSLESNLKAIGTEITAANGGVELEAMSKAKQEVIPGPVTAELVASTPQMLAKCVNAQYQQLKKDEEKLLIDKKECANSSAQAEKLCSMVRSEKAQAVQKLMSIGATILSKVTAASEACGTTADLSKVAQGGMMLAQGACSAKKFLCDSSCDDAEKTLKMMQAKIAVMETCAAKPTIAAAESAAKISAAVKKFKAEIDGQLAEGKAIPAAIVQCKAHKLDIALMGATALGFLSAAQDASACKKQLAAGETANSSGTSTSSLAGAQITTAEYCSMPANAASLTCKCTNDPNAEGCLGSIANSGVNIGKINSGAGVSAFASAKQNGLGAVNSIGKDPFSSGEVAPGANLSDAAREALGIGAAADAVTSGGGSVGGGSAEAAKKGKSDEEKETPKYGFFSSLGGMMGGGRGPSAAANAAARKIEQEQAIKRKLASDQVRAEVTTASGKSNFDKIRSRYQQNAASFEQ